MSGTKALEGVPAKAVCSTKRVRSDNGSVFAGQSNSLLIVCGEDIHVYCSLVGES